MGFNLQIDHLDTGGDNLSLGGDSAMSNSSSQEYVTDLVLGLTLNGTSGNSAASQSVI